MSHIAEDSLYSKEVKFSASARYRICVQGYLDCAISDYLAGMSIDSSSQDRADALTILTGSVSDQAELISVLTSLYNLQMPILSVQIIA